jgi:hypothetical protein
MHQMELQQLDSSGTAVATMSQDGRATQRAPCGSPKVTIWTLIRSPFSTIRRIITYLTSFVPLIYRLNLHLNPERRQLPPRDTASRFIRQFEELYSSRHLPFADTGYAEVTRRCKEDLQFLMVVLVSEEHDDTTQFCRDVLCDDRLKEWIIAHECVIWAGNVADSEAHTGTPLDDGLS